MCGLFGCCDSGSIFGIGGLMNDLTFQMQPSIKFAQCEIQPCIYHVYKNGRCRKHQLLESLDDHGN